MTGIRDVAQKAGVSAATTSRVLTGKGIVSDPLRQRVLAAAKELDYSPNGLARSMSLRRTHTLGLVVSDITNPFFTAVARGVEDSSQAGGYSVVICNSDEQVEKERSYLSVLREKRVDGIILAVSGTEVQHVRRLVEAGVHVVLIDRAVPELRLPSVMVDNYGGVLRATEYLLRLGHRRIGVVGGANDASSARERLKGFKAGLTAANIPLDPSLIVPGDFTEEGGHNATLRLWRRGDRPSAIIFLNNLMTTGGLLALRQAGAIIAEDISIVGFDDLPYFELLDRPPTVVAQPMYELGRYASELLVQSIESKGDLEPQEIRLPTKLIVRDSCAPYDDQSQEERMTA